METSKIHLSHLSQQNQDVEGNKAIYSTLGVFPETDNRVLNGPRGLSLRFFARTAHKLCSATLRYAHFASLAGCVHGFAHSLGS